MECFGFSCRFKVPNILKNRRGDPELRKHRKNREQRNHAEDDRNLRNEIWRSVSQAVESSKITNLARTFNDWFNKHVPGHQRREKPITPPQELSQLAVIPDEPCVGDNHKKDLATTSGKQDPTPAGRKPRVARIKPVPKRRLSSQNLSGDITEDQDQQTVSLDLSAVADGKDCSGRRKTVKKVSKARKKEDQKEPEEGQYLEVDKLRRNFSFRQGEDNVSLSTLGKPALPPIRSNPSDVKKRRRKVKHMSESTKPIVTPQQLAVDCTDAIVETHDQSAAGADVSVLGTMKDAKGAVATAQILSFYNSDLDGVWMGDTSVERETGEEEVSGTKRKRQPKTQIPLRRVKTRVRFLIEEEERQDSVTKFFRNQDAKPSKPLYRPQHNEAWPLQKKYESEKRRQLYRPVEKNQSASDTTYARQGETRIRSKGENKYSKHDIVEKAHLSASETEDAGDFNVDEAIADILRVPSCIMRILRLDNPTECDIPHIKSQPRSHLVLLRTYCQLDCLEVRLMTQLLICIFELIYQSLRDGYGANCQRHDGIEICLRLNGMSPTAFQKS